MKRPLPLERAMVRFLELIGLRMPKEGRVYRVPVWAALLLGIAIAVLWHVLSRL